MNHTEILTRYTANFVDELIKNGLTNVVISPGSRSTPLALTFTEHPDIKEWVIIDERSAAFFALGIAKQTKHPVALVCTSGTAAANYFPAIVEAHYSRVPLIILTADRPHELRDVGAPQAIEQIKLYGDYVKWFQEMALPESSPSMLQYVRNKAARAFYMAQEGNPGPIHLNFPFREPLNPDFSLDHLWGEASQKSSTPTLDGRKQLAEEQLLSLVKKLQDKRKGVIVCGPQVEDAFAEAVVDLAVSWGLPILADPLSQIRSGKHAKDHIIEGYDAFLKSETIRKRLKPDFILRFGAMPVSKPYLFYVKEHQDAMQFIVENHTGFREPTGNVTEFIFADPIPLCKDLVDTTKKCNTEATWLGKWQQMNRIAKKHLLGEAEKQITEGEAVRGLLEVLPEESSLYVGNSMAIRDVDTFFMTTEKDMTILANRGANGIDGMVSSGIGAAAAGKPVTLLLGDLSFFHDLNGLLAAKHYQLNITILLINNNGGGIFSFLSQASDKNHFEALFGTPLDIDFKHVIAMYGGKYAIANNETALKAMLKDCYNYQGLSVIEVQTDRSDNVDWHKKKWQAIEQEILMREE
ncbi:2-succinyl-5-enolpyruvyl-6-hydroxy-3-cyclohexene-1-carboxylate synthase [Virgibacillus halotolerans]|uniref:2-succinyl-5-enolpyruvyl-6-hydroxy-3- cyclohexene-1-carboxylic-acid synthase n=1 Tax=Virgibacillus halotolerans TaxID=1071053 RepID=UPI00195F921C|nr:2-succinyl-5-enolpyruvyl-6-hydroxy-3-cyclohexene-1-carboxylic-acid synthase [Virgibacillus halotolerans]MBM7600725.1 2-succinyl-5-enolpyruvyl-6-hydroxy-3-cyclohexene-1-carboxylate synthase [Virgibacillus halotolerans]